ncbi:MAG TPA: hypothetical protein VG838_04890 [Opitutaceae bacterium]|nr:hypothetical protein [Opitutaceae bacterium]
MPDLSYDQIQAALGAQSLFEDKTWQLSPSAWPLTADQVTQLEAIGAACLEFHQALETLYLRAAAGKNLLRNKPLLAPWVADYLDRGKPAALIAHARDPKNRGVFPTVLRPDLLITDDGFVMTELDSVPGGIGLTAFLNRLYGGETDPAILGHRDAMIGNFHAALTALRPGVRNPLIALVVSDEAATYRPEMQWLAHQLQLQGRRVFCLRPEDIFPLGSGLFFDVEGNPEKIDIIYRFFELFDLGNIRTANFIFEAWAAGEVAISPPLRPFQEEKLMFALFHHHRLQDFWAETLDSRTLALLRGLIPASWAMDPAPLPPGAVLEGPRAAGRALHDWRDLAGASQKERDLIIKISGYHETAWGARSVVLGSDSSREEWQQAVARAVELAPANLHLLQAYRKPRRLEHPLYVAPAAGVPPAATVKAGRLRLCPYYFLIDGRPRLSGALATFCPPDKKIIHGMQDAALLPCRVTG